MHQNANIAYNLQEANALLATALVIMPRTSSGGGGAVEKTPDETVAEMAILFQERTPEFFTMEEAHETAFTRRGEHQDSLSTVLGQEMVRFNKLLTVVSTTLRDVQRAIQGEILLDATLDALYTCFMKNMVPPVWETAAYPSLKPLSQWFNDLVARCAFIRLWLTTGPPTCFWMGGLVFPQGFMTGVLQNFSRKWSIAIDVLNFAYAMLPLEDPAKLKKEHIPDDGVLVNGLFIACGSWDYENKLLVDPLPGKMFSNLPIIHFLPSDSYKSSGYLGAPRPGLYATPVYKTTVRQGMLSTTGMSTNYVVPVDLPTKKSSDFWILRGCALICAVND